MPDRNAPASLASDITVEPVNHGQAPKAGRYQTPPREFVEIDLNAPDMPASDMSNERVARNSSPMTAADLQELDGLIRGNPAAPALAEVGPQKAEVAGLSTIDRLKQGISELGDKMKELADKILNIKRPNLDNLTVDNVLDDPNQKKFLRDQMKKSLNVENLEFLAAVKEYDKNPSREAATDIHDKYIAEGVRSQINIPGRMQDDLGRQINDPSTTFDSDFFKDANKEITNLVTSSDLPVLINNPEFINYMGEASSLEKADLEAERSAIEGQQDKLMGQLDSELEARNAADALKKEIDNLTREIEKIDKDITAPNLNNVMANDEGREALLNYVNGEFSPENVTFLIDVEEFNAAPTTDKALAINNKYISSGLINLSSKERNSLAALGGLSANDPLPDNFSFATAKAGIQLLVQADTLPRFKKTPGGALVEDKIKVQLREKKFELIQRSDKLKSDLWKNSQNGLKQGTQESVQLENKKLIDKEPPKHRYAART